MNNYNLAVTFHVAEFQYRELTKNFSLVEKRRLEDQLQEILQSGPVSIIVYKDQKGRLKHERT